MHDHYLQLPKFRSFFSYTSQCRKTPYVVEHINKIQKMSNLTEGGKPVFSIKHPLKRLLFRLEKLSNCQYTR